jgi:hypothetical protein
VGIEAEGCKILAMRAKAEDERIKQVMAGACLVLGIAVLVVASLLGWRYIPGWVGEWLGAMIGVMTTPFFMEASFLILGLAIVVGLNGWRRRRLGDELVYLEEIDEAAVTDPLPERVKWAIYQKKPLAGEVPSLREQAEGAVAIGDFEQAAECIAAMDAAELRERPVLEIRLALARASGRMELAGELEAELAGVQSQEL